MRMRWMWLLLLWQFACVSHEASGPPAFVGSFGSGPVPGVRLLEIHADGTYSIQVWLEDEILETREGRWVLEPPRAASDHLTLHQSLPEPSVSAADLAAELPQGGGVLWHGPPMHWWVDINGDVAVLVDRHKLTRIR